MRPGLPRRRQRPPGRPRTALAARSGKGRTMDEASPAPGSTRGEPPLVARPGSYLAWMAVASFRWMPMWLQRAARLREVRCVRQRHASHREPPPGGSRPWTRSGNSSGKPFARRRRTDGGWRRPGDPFVTTLAVLGWAVRLEDGVGKGSPARKGFTFSLREHLPHQERGHAHRRGVDGAGSAGALGRPCPWWCGGRTRPSARH
jgi:hypothetical protein